MMPTLKQNWAYGLSYLVLSLVRLEWGGRNGPRCRQRHCEDLPPSITLRRRAVARWKEQMATSDEDGMIFRLLKMAQLCLITTIPPSLRPLCHDLGHIASQSFSRSRMTKQVEQIRMRERRSRRGHEFSHLSLHVVWLAPMMLLLPDRPSSYRCHPMLVAQPHQKASGRSGEHGRTNMMRATRRRVTSLFVV